MRAGWKSQQWKEIQHNRACRKVFCQDILCIKVFFCLARYLFTSFVYISGFRFMWQNSHLPPAIFQPINPKRIHHVSRSKTNAGIFLPVCQGMSAAENNACVGLCLKTVHIFSAGKGLKCTCHTDVKSLLFTVKAELRPNYQPSSSFLQILYLLLFKGNLY